LSSDFIVGFPGESDADFEATLDLVREIGFAQSYSFKYSPRPGTPAAAARKQIPEVVQDERLARLQALLNSQISDFAAGLVGQTFDVLFERPGRYAGQLIGRSPHLQPVHVFAPDHAIGDFARVRVTEAKPRSVSAEIVPARAPEARVAAVAL
jgi:tRNA-2-methylthio-N6-dimethylallyladenosine synthase